MGGGSTPDSEFDAVLADLAREVIPDQRWDAMLRRAFGPDTSVGAADVRQFQHAPHVLRFDRSLPAAAAAASGDRRVAGRRTNSDGDLLTDVHETGDGRLVVTISARPGSSALWRKPALVTLRWQTRAHQPALVECTRVLATPLALGPDGGLIARYELGSVEHLDALAVYPAVWTNPDEVDEDAIRTAFAVTAYGNALRAWRRYVDEAPARLANLIRQLLPPGSDRA
jgi:hypothetical protein